MSQVATFKSSRVQGYVDLDVKYIVRIGTGVDLWVMFAIFVKGCKLFADLFSQGAPNVSGTERVRHCVETVRAPQSEILKYIILKPIAIWLRIL